MEAIVVIVGFLGVGKTTLLKKVVQEYLTKEWDPFIILNDYENAALDSQDFLKFLRPDQINALTGSCICCSGLNEMRKQINGIGPRKKGITLIEANGTTDASNLMGFLGVGLKDHFLPPIQISVVDVRNWQKRGHQNNELEANQVQMSSLIILNYVDQVPIERVVEVEQDIANYNSTAKKIHWNDIDVTRLPELHPNLSTPKEMEYKKSHWASCSIELPNPICSKKLQNFLENLPKTILRVKACTRLDDSETYSFIEMVPTGDVFIRPYTGALVSGPALLTIGPGSDPILLKQLLSQS